MRNDFAHAALAVFRMIVGEPDGIAGRQAAHRQIGDLVEFELVGVLKHVGVVIGGRLPGRKALLELEANVADLVDDARIAVIAVVFRLPAGGVAARQILEHINPKRKQQDDCQ